MKNSKFEKDTKENSLFVYNQFFWGEGGNAEMVDGQGQQ